MFASAKGNQQVQCQEQCIHHIPYYLSGLYFFATTFRKMALYKPFQYIGGGGGGFRTDIAFVYRRWKYNIGGMVGKLILSGSLNLL